MSWIKTIVPEDAQGRLKKIYDRIAGTGGQVDHVLQVHSLRPHTLEGHMVLYKNVLHHSANTLPVWFLEAIGVYVSHLNACAYCVEHHLAGMRQRLDDNKRADAIGEALLADQPDAVFSNAELQLMCYARALTLEPSKLSESVVSDLRAAGVTDGEVLEVNQVVGYFCYANRTVLGLGVSTDGEALGLSPSDSEALNDWRHQ